MTSTATAIRLAAPAIATRLRERALAMLAREPGNQAPVAALSAAADDIEAWAKGLRGDDGQGDLLAAGERGS